MSQWLVVRSGFEYLEGGRLYETSHLHGVGAQGIGRSGLGFTFFTEIAPVNKGEQLVITREKISSKDTGKLERDESGLVEITHPGSSYPEEARFASATDSIFRFELGTYFSNWQILGLVPEHMGLPSTRRTAQRVKTLHRDGSNVAEILNWLAHDNRDVFESIVETMREVLGYADRIDPRQDLGAIRSRFLELDETGFTVPGWMMSTGSLRIIGLLIALRCAKTPTLVLIEEIENGLDPRTLGLLMEEIKFLTANKKVQVIATTHSPHLLDQVELDQVIFVQRREGVPHFLKPSQSDHVEGFRNHFSPGRLYTMGVLSEAVRQLP